MSLLENDAEGEPKMKKARGSESERERDEDRLSDLPDCVLLHLMEFLRTKDAVRTCVLSRRWKDLWKRLHTLTLHSLHFQFRQMTLFNKFVPKVLSCRDGSIALHNLDFLHNGRVPPQLLKRVVRYAVSHNVQQLKLSVQYDLELPPCIFSCQTLTSLDLSVYRGWQAALFPKSLNLKALTSLHLRNFAFCASDNELVEPFSSCIKLKTLVINRCVIKDPQILCISNATLDNLTIHVSPFYHEEAYRIVLSTPNLCSFVFSGVPAQQLSANNLSFLKEVNIDADDWAAARYLQSAFILISWLQVLANVRSLTLCSSTLQVLSLIPDLLNTEPPCLGNLKSLVVKVKKPSPIFHKPRRTAKSRKAKLKSSSPVPDGVVDYLIRNSPFAELLRLVSGFAKVTCHFEDLTDEYLTGAAFEWLTGCQFDYPNSLFGYVLLRYRIFA